MKIKRDFVTNSSSTSFIISGKYDGGIGIDKVKDIFNDLIQDYRKKTEWDKDTERPPSIKSEMIQKTGPDTFYVKDFIPQNNNKEDIPQWIKDIFINNDSEAGRKLESSGIRITQVELKNFND